jgi:hypothetical protein
VNALEFGRRQPNFVGEYCALQQIPSSGQKVVVVLHCRVAAKAALSRTAAIAIPDCGFLNKTLNTLCSYFLPVKLRALILRG